MRPCRKRSCDGICFSNQKITQLGTTASMLSLALVRLRARAALPKALNFFASLTIDVCAQAVTLSTFLRP